MVEPTVIELFEPWPFSDYFSFLHCLGNQKCGQSSSCCIRKSDDSFEGKEVLWLFEWKLRELIFFFLLFLPRFSIHFGEWITFCSCSHSRIWPWAMKNMEPKPDVFSNGLGSKWWNWDMDSATQSMIHNLLCLQSILRQWLLRAYGSVQPMTGLTWSPHHVRDSVADTA